MHALIVEDEFMVAERLQSLLEEHCPEIASTHICLKPSEGLIYLKENTVDLLLLDIEMPQMNGFEFIEIAGLDHLPPVVFTTAHAKYAVQAFKVNALDYLLKPHDPADLKKAVSKVNNLPHPPNPNLAQALEKGDFQDPDRLPLSSGQVYHFVRFKDIVRVESQGSYTEFYLEDDRKIMTSKHIKTYRDRLLAKGFIRPHQSHLVNRAYVSAFDRSAGTFLVLESGAQVPVSARLRKEVLQLLGLF